MSALEELTSNDFENLVINSNERSVVQFTANWCVPCRAVKMALSDLIPFYESEMGFFSINIDSTPHIAESWNVSSIPAILFFDKGQCVARLNGPNTRSTIAGILNNLKDRTL